MLDFAHQFTLRGVMFVHVSSVATLQWCCPFLRRPHRALEVGNNSTRMYGCGEGCLCARLKPVAAAGGVYHEENFERVGGMDEIRFRLTHFILQGKEILSRELIKSIALHCLFKP